MTTMTKKRVAELEGAQLDWAVALALGAKIVDHYGRAKLQWDGSCAVMDVLKSTLMISTPNYSSDWSEGGPIIEREGIEIQLHASSDGWWAGIGQPLSQNKSGGATATGPTALIAAMRAFVASKLGDGVEVPA